jgi:hypothetical protein
MELCPCYWRCDCKEQMEKTLKRIRRIKAIEQSFNGVTERDERGHHKVPIVDSSVVAALKQVRHEYLTFGALSGRTLLLMDAALSLSAREAGSASETPTVPDGESKE